MSPKRLTSFVVAICTASILVVASPAIAADAPAAPSTREACAADFVKHCAGKTPGTDEARACMRDHQAELSEPCRTAIEARRQERRERVKAACTADIAKFCNTGSPTGEGVGRCLRDHKAELSETCKAAFPNRDG